MRALMFALSRHEGNSARVKHWLRQMLSETSGDLLADVLDGLTRIHDVEVAMTVLALAHDHSEYVRGAVLRYARELVPTRAWMLLTAAASDAHYVVRENVADELAALRDPRSRSLLETLANDEHPHVRQAATSALAELDRRPR